MKRIDIVIMLVISTFLYNPVSSYGQFSAQEEKPNFLFILVDDLGWGDLACQGATDLLTPNIDGIAEQGMILNSFYANCPVCSPSRASFLTGRYPDMVGVPGVIRQWEDNSWGYLNENAVLLPQILVEQGYHSAIIGKWHLGFKEPNTPNDRGFDHFRGFLGDMMDDYWTHLRGGENWMRFNESEINPEGHATDIFTDWAIEYMQLRKEKKNPFFLYLAYNAPHFPIQPPRDYLDRVKEREPNLSEKRTKNVAFIEHLDFSAGRVMKYLEESGLIENTLVVFTSDNGGALSYAQSNGKLRGGKQQMYEGGIRVPAFVIWKNKIKPGSNTNNLTMLMDFFPTFCEVAGAEISHSIDGMSILPTLLGQEQNTDERYVFWVRREGGDRYGGQAYYAARYGDYKVLQNSAYEPFQYFNIGSDEYEKNPLDQPQDKAFKLLRQQLEQHIRKSGKIPWQDMK